MYDIFLIAYVGIMKGFNLRKIKASMAKSQNMSLRLVLTDLVKPKKRKRVAKEIDQFGDKTDQPQSKTMKVVVNEHISPKKEKEVYKKENLGTIDEEKPTTENKDVNVTQSCNVDKPTTNSAANKNVEKPTIALISPTLLILN